MRRLKDSQLQTLVVSKSMKLFQNEWNISSFLVQNISADCVITVHGQPVDD